MLSADFHFPTELDFPNEGYSCVSEAVTEGGSLQVLFAVENLYHDCCTIDPELWRSHPLIMWHTQEAVGGLRLATGCFSDEDV